MMIVNLACIYMLCKQINKFNLQLLLGLVVLIPLTPCTADTAPRCGTRRCTPPVRGCKMRPSWMLRSPPIPRLVGQSSMSFPALNLPENLVENFCDPLSLGLRKRKG